MLKHVQATAHGQRHPSGSDTTSSSLSRSSSHLALMRPNDFSRRSPSLSATSRASSFVSLTNFDSKLTPIKVYASCLRSDIEYKTLGISHQTTSTEVIWMLLSKYKMRHRDPKLFYLTMDIDFASEAPTSNLNSKTLRLDDHARPAELRLCYPKGDCKFTLQMQKGGLIRVYDSVLMAESNYKCLLISDKTTVAEVINILFHCYGLERIERVNRYCMVQVKNDCLESGVKLHPDDCPAVLQTKWISEEDFKWILQREIYNGLCDGVEAMSTTSSSSSYSSSSSGTVSERSLSSCDDEKDYSLNYNSYITNHNPMPEKGNKRGQNCTRIVITKNSMKESEFRASSSTIPSSCLQPQQNISSVLIEHCPVVIDRPPKSLPRRSMPSRPLAGSPPPHRQLPKPNFNLNSAININILGFKQPQPQQSYPSVTSIHESGLPSRQHHLLGRSSYLSKCLVSRQEQSLVWLTPGTRKPFAAMPDYENYFYI